MAINYVHDNIYLGSWQDARNAYEMDVLFSVAFDAPYEGDFTYNLVDGPHNNNKNILEKAINHLWDIKKRDPSYKILVHCVSGISRSPAIVVGYLMKYGYSLEDALNLVKEKHPSTQIHQEFIDLLTNEVKL